MQMYWESENPYFSCIYFLTWISLLLHNTCIVLMGLKTCTCIAEICMEESVSKNVDLGLSFYAAYI